MTKKAFLWILFLSIFFTWISKNSVYTHSFTQNGIQTGSPLKYYFCQNPGNCYTDYSLFTVNVFIVFIVCFLVYKIISKKKK